MHWTVLRSTYALDHRWIKVRRDECLLPNGVVIDDYFWFESPDNTVVVALTANGEAVLVEQYKHAAHSVMWEFPGGVIDPGEEPEAAARRELLEETGFGGGDWLALGVFYGNPTKSNARTYIYLAQGVEWLAVPHGDPTEEIQVHHRPWAALTPLQFSTTSSALALSLALAHVRH